MKNTNTHIPQPSDIDSTTQFEYTNKVESASANEAASDGFKLKSCFGLKYWKDEATGLKRGSFYTGSWFPFFKTSVSWAILPKNRKWEERVVTERARGLVSFSETQSQLEDIEDGNALFLVGTILRWVLAAATFEVATTLFVPVGCTLTSRARAATLNFGHSTATVLSAHARAWASPLLVFKSG